jgi:hypothetical protein
MSGYIEIDDMPDLGAVSDTSYVVGERAGSGLFSAAALRAYCAANVSEAMAPVVAAPTIAEAVVQLGALGTITTTTPALQFDLTEALNAGVGGFYTPIVVNHRRTAGGVGHRQAFIAQLITNGAGVNEFLVGISGFSFIETGSGTAFGGNAYARTYAGAAATSQSIGLEVNTDAQANNQRKIGINIVDVATSVGDGSDASAAIYIARQPGGLGYRDGILFGDDDVLNMGGARQTLIRAADTAGSVAATRGIDFRSAVFTDEGIALPALGGAAGDITWGYGGAGGILRSDTTANGPVVHFGNNGWTVQGATGSTAISCNTTATPNVQLYVTGVGLRQIAAGAADSGGAGLRTLVVPN